MKVVFLFAFLPLFKGRDTVQLLSCEGLLEIRYCSTIMLPLNKPPWGPIRGGLIYKNDLFRWGLIREFMVVMDRHSERLQVAAISSSTCESICS